MNESTGSAPSSEQTASQASGCVCGGKGPMLSQMLDLMMPSAAAGEHFKNARLEFLKGVRELLDQRIHSLSEKPRTGTKLNVE
jgi:hypothetical protein